MGKKRTKQRRNEAKVERKVERGKAGNKADDLSPNFSPPGLMNLGNTCFFNSIVQNLLRTKSLESALKDRSPTFSIPPHEGAEGLDFILGGPGPLTKAWLQFLDEVSEIRGKVSRKRSVSVSPRNLFTQFCNKNARFKGYEQHDLQELFHCFLTTLKDEEIKQRKQGILRSLGLLRSRAGEVPGGVRDRVRYLGGFAAEAPTSVDLVFGGKLRSSVMCDQCGTVSEIEESFHDISLPIVEGNHKPPHHNAGNNGDNNDNRMNNGDNNGDNNAGNNGDENDNGDNENMVKLIKKETLQSKHSVKKSKKQRKRESKIKRKKLNFEAKKFEESLQEFASSVSRQIIFQALSEISPTLNVQVKGGQNISENESFLSETENNDNLTETLTENKIERLGETLDVPVERLQKLRLSDSSVSHETTDKDSSENDGKKRETLFDTPLCPRVEKIFTEFCRSLPRTLKERELPLSQECSVRSCLFHFTRAELLSGSDRFQCGSCRAPCCASKQLLVSAPPTVLVIHFKRFQQSRFNLRKSNKKVEVPPMLDISSACTSACKVFADASGGINYGLFGAVEHQGTLNRGHYTAYVKARCGVEPEPMLEDFDFRPLEETASQWFHISDTNVSMTSQEKALNCNAYMLFYERVGTL